jgi:acyl-[acyl-carrier-protein]-phospholipid O-acyltransferase/long-chain-fatty-acid--[acyl-carrier-protein] ligase
VFHANENVVTVLLLVYTLSVGLGSVAIGAMLKGSITDKFVPLAAGLMALGCLDLWFAAAHFSAGAGDGGVRAFLSSPGAFHVLFALALLGFAGGMFIVPLYAILQTRSRVQACAQSIAANNILNALFMVLASLLALVLLRLGLSVPQLIGSLGVETLVLTLIGYGPRLLRKRSFPASQ